jgi:predicted nucleic acid-binding Zn finger protein
MTNTIQTGSILTATSIGDSNCIWTATVIERKGNFITAKINGEVVRKKVNVYNGEEFVYLLGKYSMCPTFRAK